VPFLIAEEMASNIGGTSTLVGDPPNIIIGSRAGLSYNDFLIHLAPFVALLIVVLVGLCRVLFRSAFAYDPEWAAQIAALRERDAIRNGRLLAVSLAVLALITAAFVLQTVLRVEPSVVAIVGGLLLLGLSRLDATDVTKDVEWPTLAFLAGLFVMVGALVATGVVGHIARAATAATEDRSVLRLDDPAVGLDGTVRRRRQHSVRRHHEPGRRRDGAHRRHQPVAGVGWALALGADLGGNATAVGASANVVVIGLAERAGRRITFWQFTK
jgi:Na+/H+ antiporter NhaD/arsenite permease-like protein